MAKANPKKEPASAGTREEEARPRPSRPAAGEGRDGPGHSPRGRGVETGSSKGQSASQEDGASNTAEGHSGAARYIGDALEDCGAPKSYLGATEQDFGSLAAWIAASEKQWKQALRDLDTAVVPKLNSVQRTVESLAAQQNEVRIRTLPEWRTDVGTEIQQLRNDLAEQRDHTESCVQRLSEDWAQQRETLLDFQMKVQDRLTAEVAGHRARTARSEATAAELAESLAQAHDDLLTSSTQSQQGLVAVSRKLEDGNSALEANVGQLAERLRQLEGVCGQLTLEGTSMRRQHAEDFGKAQADIKTMGQLAQQRVEEQSAEHQAAVQMAREAMEDRLSLEVRNLTDRLGVAEDKATRVSRELSESDEKQIAATSRLSEELQRKALHIERQAASEAQQTLRTIRAEEGKRLAALEESFKKTQDSHHRLMQQHRDDIATLEDTVAKAKRASDSMVQEMVATNKERHQQFQQGIEELAYKFEETSSAIAHADHRMSGITAMMNTMEIKMWPWRTRDKPPAPHEWSQLQKAGGFKLLRDNSPALALPADTMTTSPAFGGRHPSGGHASGDGGGGTCLSRPHTARAHRTPTFAERDFSGLPAGAARTAARQLQEAAA